MEERREADESLLSAGMTSTSLRLCLLPCAAGVMIILWIKKTDDSGVGVEDCRWHISFHWHSVGKTLSCEHT